MVPNGWKYLSLEQVSKIIDCKHRTPEYVESGIPLVSPGTIKWGELDLISPTKRVTQDEYSSLMDHCIVDIGDLVLSRNQSVGVASYVNSNAPFVLGQDTVLVKPTKSEAGFLFYNLQSEETQRTIFKLAGGSTFSRINLSEIRKLKTHFPPLPEQRKIAKILSTWDQAIATTERLIATSQQQKKALMQQLLTGKKRLVNPETGEVFEGDWKVYKFASLFKERVEVGRADLPLLSITADDGVVYQEETGRKNTSNDDKSKYRRICKDDIGYNTMRMWQGRSSLSDKEGIVSPAYTIVIPNEKVVPSFASYLFKLPEMVHVFYRNSQGLVSDTWNLKFTHFKKITWAFPTVKEQNSIALVLTSTDKEIGLLHAKLAHLKNEKKALMQQLLTGKRRVKIDAVEVA